MHRRCWQRELSRAIHRAPDPCKSKVAAADKIVILTFGLLSPGKGIEFMIDALPDIVSSHPEVLYFVVGATHPHYRADSGEDYRLNLHHRAKELGVGDNIVFYDRFLERDELLEIIRAADIYVTPYLNEAQIVSGHRLHANAVPWPARTDPGNGGPFPSSPSAGSMHRQHDAT